MLIGYCFIFHFKPASHEFLVTKQVFLHYRTPLEISHDSFMGYTRYARSRHFVF